MAIDPTQLAEEQAQREGINIAGQPTEVARGPQEYVQLAGPVRSFFDLLASQGRRVIGEGGQAARVPTPQEAPLVGETAAQIQERLAPQVLSPEGVTRFREMGGEAPAPGRFGEIQQEEEVLQSAAEALDEQAAAASTGAQNINQELDIPLGEPVTPPEITDEVAERAAAAAVDPDAPLRSLQEGGDFNFNYIENPEDIGRVITELGATFADETVAAARGVISNETTLDDAARLAADEIGLTRRILNRRIGEGAINASEMVAARELLVRSARRITELAETVSSGTATAAQQLEFRRQLSIHAAIQMQVKGMQTEVARTLQSFQIPVSGEMSADRLNAEALRMLNEGGIDEASTRALADRIGQLGALPEGQRAAAINEITQRGWYARTKEAATEAYLSGLLSSPATQARNTLGTASFMLFQLPSEMIAGAYGAAIRGGNRILAPNRVLPEDQVYVQDAFIRLRGWMDSYRDALRAGGIAFQTEVPASMATKIDAPVGGIRSSMDNPFGRAINEFGRRARYPFRFLLGADEFFKTISQRGELYVRAHQRYQASLRAGNDHQTALDDAGMMLLDPSSAATELSTQARYDTMMSDLGAFGRLARQIQDTIPGRIILPFFTAPTNDFLRTMEHIPFMPSRTYSDLAGRNGERARQMALGRWSLGGATLATVAQYAQDGHLTGSMPSTEAARNALPPGWQPYSIVLRGENFPTDENGEPMPLYDAYGRPNGPLTYVSYAGYGPVSSVLGIGSDVTQRMYMMRDPSKNSNIASAAIAATADYYRELPMLQGVSEVINVLEAASRGDALSVERILRSPAEAATPLGFPSPVSSLQRNIQRAIDPTRVVPREDIQYVTMDDLMAGVAEGRRGYVMPDGSPNYRLVGQPAGDAGTVMRQAFEAVDAYQSRDSIFRDELDLNVPRYDVMGNIVGESDISIETAPGLAAWNLTTGMTIRQGETPTPTQDELMRLAVTTGGSVLSNPDRRDGVRLSPGAQSDLVRIAKNEVTLRQPGAGYVDFRGALDNLINTNAYIMAQDAERRSMIQTMQDQYFEAGFDILLQLDQYANLRQAVEDRRNLQEQGMR
jgi:hypothetical protein